MRSELVVLFDIDGTLVRKTGPYHRDALSVAVRKVFGLQLTTEGIPVHGMLDPDILTAMLKREGLAESTAREAMPRLQKEAEEYYLRVCPELQHAICPGVHSLLGRLYRRGTAMALVTGNFTRIGWHKLERAGLRRYFSFGAFAELAGTRAELAAIAARQLGAKDRVMLVGDAPSDIEAARANGFIAVSVYTGVSTKEELARLEPDYLLPTLDGVLAQRFL